MSNGKSFAIYRQAQRIKELELMLKVVADELMTMIDSENKRLKGNTKCTDESPPDFIDYQTVYEAHKLLETN